MRELSEGRQNFLSHFLVAELTKEGLVDKSKKEVLFEKIRHAFSEFDKETKELDALISKRILSIKRGILQGSSEWDVLYTRFYEEEFRKKSRLLLTK